jgi:hypothetical protein
MFLAGFKKSSLLALTSFLFFVFVSTVNAGMLNSSVLDSENTKDFAGSAGYEGATKDTLSTTVAGIIEVFLGLLGTIFLVLIIVSGWNWFMAQGDSKKLETAKARMFNAVIGLIIVVSAYAITVFVFKSADSLGVIGGGGGSGSGMNTSSN